MSLPIGRLSFNTFFDIFIIFDRYTHIRTHIRTQTCTHIHMNFISLFNIEYICIFRICYCKSEIIELLILYFFVIDMLYCFYILFHLFICYILPLFRPNVICCHWHYAKLMKISVGSYKEDSVQFMLYI